MDWICSARKLVYYSLFIKDSGSGDCVSIFEGCCFPLTVPILEYFASTHIQTSEARAVHLVLRSKQVGILAEDIKSRNEAR